MLIAVDAGNYKTKFCTRKGVGSFSSPFAPYYDLSVSDMSQDSDDMVIHYKGVREFAGSLAIRENPFADEGETLSRYGATKNHEDAVKRILIAICKAKIIGDIDLIVGQPIANHASEKEAIKARLLGHHEISINGHSYSFNVRRARVAVEGASAAFILPNEPLHHIIDVGSGTINFATLKGGHFVNHSSGTIPQGVETADFPGLMAVLDRKLSNAKWQRSSIVTVCGGRAEDVADELRARAYDRVDVADQPSFATVLGMYALGKKVFA